MIPGCIHDWMALHSEDLTTPEAPLEDPSGPGVHTILSYTDEDCKTPTEQEGGVAGYLSEPQTDGPADEAPCWRYNFGHGRWKMAVTWECGEGGEMFETMYRGDTCVGKPMSRKTVAVPEFLEAQDGSCYPSGWGKKWDRVDPPIPDF